MLPVPEMEFDRDYDPFDGIAWTNYSYGGENGAAPEEEPGGDDEVVWPEGRGGRDGYE